MPSLLGGHVTENTGTGSPRADAYCDVLKSQASEAGHTCHAEKDQTYITLNVSKPDLAFTVVK